MSEAKARLYEQRKESLRRHVREVLDVLDGDPDLARRALVEGRRVEREIIGKFKLGDRDPLMLAPLVSMIVQGIREEPDHEVLLKGKSPARV